MNSQKAQGYTGNYIKVVFYLFLQVLDNGTILGQMKVHCQNISYQLRSWWGGGEKRKKKREPRRGKEGEGRKEREERRGEIRWEETTVTSCKIHVKSVSRCLLYMTLHIHINWVPLSWSVWPYLHTWACCMCPHSSGLRGWGVCVCVCGSSKWTLVYEIEWNHMGDTTIISLYAVHISHVPPTIMKYANTNWVMH